MAANTLTTKFQKYWFQPVNNSPLITFRILFGCIMLMEFGGDLYDGWVKHVYTIAPFRFTFIGFEFLQNLNGDIMYLYFSVATAMALLVIFGLFYRPAIIIIALLWSGVYFSQKGHYNNHYYLMMLISWIMTIMPANKRTSLDVKFGLTKASNVCYRWCIQVFIIQIAIVYIYASIAKMYPDWLLAKPVQIWFSSRANHPTFGFLFGSKPFAFFISYMGILFDLLIVPALLWKKTRNLSVAAMLIFHYFNGVVFGIGVFPFLAMSLNVFFFPGKTFDNVLGIESNTSDFRLASSGKQRFITIMFGTYLIWQVLTPLRHHLIPGDVLWTEEGHRMAWRMMLRTKKGEAKFKVVDKRTDSSWYEFPEKHMLSYQAKDVASKPDFIWQFSQHLKNKYKEQGLDVRVYAYSRCSVNGRPYKYMVDTTVDLAAEEWNLFKHHDWILTDFK